MFSSFVRTLGSSVVISCAFVACGINTATEPPRGVTESSMRTPSWRSPEASPDHTVYYVELYPNLGGICCEIAVDPNVNQIYVSDGDSPSYGNRTAVVDGSPPHDVTIVNEFGGAANVDSKTHNVWLPGLYAGNVAVYSGTTDSIVTTVSLSDCPIGSWVDGKRRFAWITAQCGSYNDPVWAVDADTYAIVAGPINTPGVMGKYNTVNPVTGKFYFTKGKPAGYFEIDPNASFTVSDTHFGNALGVDSRADLLYAFPTAGYGLNIIDGRSETIQKTVTLPYTPQFIGVNPSLNHIYLSAGQNVIEVREATTGKLLKTKTLDSGYEIKSLAADDKRRRIYAVAAYASYVYLYSVKD